MSDDLEQFHARQLASDPQYAVARQLLELGEAVMQLREGARMTRGKLAKQLHVKAGDIAIVEEETPRASAGLLESALRLLVQQTPKAQSGHRPEVADSLRTVRQLRPSLMVA